MSQTDLNQEDQNEALLPSWHSQLAALDLGSNSFHLLIAQQRGSRIQILDRHKEMVRLAAGLDDGNLLSNQAISRALECLKRFAQRLRPLDPENVRIVGTNTLRQAKDETFLNEAERILGHKIEIISGHEEGRLIYLGVCHDLGPSDARRLVIDIGGGSTELIIGKRFSQQHIESLYMGCVSMTQRHFANGKLSKANLGRAIDSAMVELEPIMANFVDAGWDEAIGTSGTINTLQAVLQNLYGAENITDSTLQELGAYISTFKSIDQLNLPGLSEERRPVFVGGLAIIMAAFKALKIDSMTTSQSALRDGLIFDLIGRHHHDDARDRSVNGLMERFGIDRAQARHVRETSISLLSQVATEWHLTSASCKHIISWTADLHELGMTLSHSGFHKHGAYMIENMNLPGFSRSDQQQLALLVRNHRRKISPNLYTNDDPTLLRLCIILRIATLLHRNRAHVAPPHIEACAGTGEINLVIPEIWLLEHPLTALDLEQEKTYLAPTNIRLTVNRH